MDKVDAAEKYAQKLNLGGGEYAWAAYHLAKEVLELRKELAKK